jgi:hypothetical protein
MRFHEIPWGFMRFFDVLVNQSVLTEANRGLISYMINLVYFCCSATEVARLKHRHILCF